MREPGSGKTGGFQTPARYEPIEKLGSGGGGEVWRVQCRLTRREYALKVLGGHSGPRETEALVREAVALSGLEGLGLPRIFRLGKLPRTGSLYVLRELVDGESLDKFSARSPDLALVLLAEVAEQLTVLHRAGLLHGDIKPANIIAKRSGSVTLVDFGLAAPWKEGGVTPEGLTPRYAAPELLRGGALTVRAEVFSLGVILEELLQAKRENGVSSGAQTASGGRAATAGKSVRRGATSDALDFAELERVAKVATEFEPSKRYPSTDEFAAELKRALGPRVPPSASTDGVRNRPFAWPILGIEGTAARALGAVKSLLPGGALHFHGEPGSGRSALLHRIAFTLGISGTQVILLDDEVVASTELSLLELDGVSDPPNYFCLVDDAPRLSHAVRERLVELGRAGARVVSVGVVDAALASTPFDVPALPAEVIRELVRGVVPSATEDVTTKLVELSFGLPGRLRELVTLVAAGTIANATDLEQLLLDPAERALDSWGPLKRVYHMLDRGRFRDARTILDENREHPEAQSIEWVVGEARLLLGMGESSRAKALLLLVSEQQDIEPETEVGCAFQIALARAYLGQGDYAATVKVAERITFDGSASAIEAHTQKALALAYLGKTQEARALLATLLERAEALALPRLLTLVCVATGLVAQREDRHDDALDFYRRALEIGKHSPDAGLLATTQLNLAGLLKVRGDLAGAIEHFEAALDLGQRTGRVSTVRSAQLNLANLDLYLGRLARARARIDDLAKEREHLPSIIEAQLRGREAEYFAQSGQPELAAERYDACAKAYEELSRHIEAADARLEWVLVSARAPSPDVSALRVQFERARDLLGNATAHRTMLTLAAGRIATVAGEESVARAQIDKAIEEAQKNDQKEWLWRALEARADLEEQLGRRLKARRDREEALGVLEEIGAELPRDLREVYWNDPRRSALRVVANAMVTQMPDIDPLHATAHGRPMPRGVALPASSRSERERLPESDSTSKSRDVSTLLSTPLEMRLAKILEINAELAGEVSLARLTEKVIGHAVRLVRAERGLVLLRDDSGKLSVYCSKETAAGEKHLRFSKTVAETVMTTGEPVVSVNARDDQRMSGWGSVHELMLQSVACVPIRDRRRNSLGALYLETRLARGSEFSSELPMLQAFADQVAIAIQNARLVTENQKRASELSEANEKLLEAQGKLEELLGNRTQQLERTRRKLRETRDTLLGHFGYHGLVGTSGAMRRVYDLIERVKDTEVPVLITGESGTGKEMVARAIHEASSRSKRKFVGVNCGAIPENLLESELFGCVRGAFTGADRDRKGLFREHEGGTVLLDEIGEMPHKMQAGLLRVLQERKLRPVGGTDEQSVDVRLVFATHRDLESLVASKSFREDLYYRIHVVEVRMPPLRERTEDIPQLVDHFLGIFAAKHRREKKTITRDALRLLMAQPWRGNVRELEHVLLNVWVMTDEEELGVADFEAALGPKTSSSRAPANWTARATGASDSGRPAATESSAASRAPGEASVRKRAASEGGERERIIRALADCGQNRVKAAQMLGIPRRTFYRRLSDYGIE